MIDSKLPNTQKPSLMPITARPEPVMVRGNGSWLWDSDGHRYLDFIQGWAVNCLGHCPPEITQALLCAGRQGTGVARLRRWTALPGSTHALTASKD